MGLYTDDREKFTFAIDTDAYAGNFERQMFSFIFGLDDCPGEATRDLSYYKKAAEIAEAWKRMPEDFEYDLLDSRISDPGDDGYHRSYVDICPTPGYFNDGKGTHYEDTEKNRRKVSKQYPAFQSVAIYLARRPTEEEVKIIKDRAQLYCSYPQEYEWVTRPKIIGFRLLTSRTTWSSEAV